MRGVIEEEEEIEKSNTLMIVRQRVAVCCSVLQCAAVCCSVLQCVAARNVFMTVHACILT